MATPDPVESGSDSHNLTTAVNRTYHQVLSLHFQGRVGHVVPLIQLQLRLGRVNPDIYRT
jgi:hypothetical protein